jgi:glycyl-tRNA synthetase beta chain
MADFLLELRCEEIPARMHEAARQTLSLLFQTQLAHAGVNCGIITVWSTPRRLALIARDLPATTEAVSEETKGPAVGAPEQALEGFLRKLGLSKDQLEVRDLKGKDTWFAVVEKPGRAVREVLAEAIPAIVRAFPWPKSMRWGAASLSTESLRWVRPLSGIVAILGEDLVACEIEGIASGYATKGHRFHHPGEITIGSAHDYADKLRACHVLVDHEVRQDLIREKARAAASAAGLTLVEDEGLVIENAGLTEWPVPLLGRFDEAFLEVPPEVIQLTARVNQKYFVCEDAAGKLANAFVCTANIEAVDGGAAIVAGNRKVLAARLSDARFFWEQDLRKTLAQHAEGLARITFHEKLGTVADKVDRVAKLARWLVEEGIVKSIPVRPEPVEGPSFSSDEKNSASISSERTVLDLADLAEQAARLCKADLVTEMVGEFPELQGLMGGYYARAEGLPDAVADAIRDHYKPVGQGDAVPIAPVTVAVSLADKLDTLISFFAIEEQPTGSRDPFALRRAALGTLALIAENSLRLQLSDLLADFRDYLIQQNLSAQYAEVARISGRSVRELLDEFGGIGMDPNTGKVRVHGGVNDHQRTVFEIDASPELVRMLDVSASILRFEPLELLTFFADRLKVQQREAGVRHDLIDAVFALGGEDDLVRLLARVHALQAFIGSPDGANLLAGYKRAANILKKEQFEPGAVNPSPEPAEKALIDALAKAGPEAAKAVEAEQFEAAMRALATLRAPIDAFFDSVTVNDPDPAKRAARLELLDAFRRAVHNVADFSKIEG